MRPVSSGKTILPRHALSSAVPSFLPPLYPKADNQELEWLRKAAREAPQPTRVGCNALAHVPPMAPPTPSPGPPRQSRAHLPEELVVASLTQERHPDIATTTASACRCAVLRRIAQCILGPGRSATHDFKDAKIRELHRVWAGHMRIIG